MEMTSLYHFPKFFRYFCFVASDFSEVLPLISITVPFPLIPVAIFQRLRHPTLLPRQHAPRTKSSPSRSDYLLHHSSSNPPSAFPKRPRHLVATNEESLKIPQPLVPKIPKPRQFEKWCIVLGGGSPIAMNLGGSIGRILWSGDGGSWRVGEGVGSLDGFLGGPGEWLS